MACPTLAQTPATPATTPLVSFYRYDTGHTGYTADKLTTPLSLLWQHSTSASKGSQGSAVFANDTIYFGADKAIYALNAADGTLKWRFPATGDAPSRFAKTPALTGGFLYIGNDDSQIYKLDAATGKQVWAQKFGGPIRSSPVVNQNVLYFGCGDSNLYAVNADTGQTIWSYASQGAIDTSPSLTGDQICFASSDNTLYCVNITTGKKSWAVQFPSDIASSPPVYADNMLFVGASDMLYALAERSGAARWSKHLPLQISSPPTFGNGSVYVVTQEPQVYAFSDRGRQQWSAKIDYPNTGAPLLAGNTLIVPTGHGILYGFDANSGQLKWEYVVQPKITAQPKSDFTDLSSAPVYVNNTLYALSDDGNISAFRADAVDTIPPRVADLTPTPGSIVNGGRISPSVTLIDDGSGINPATVTLSLDNGPLPAATYDPTKNEVSVTGDNDIPAVGNGTHLMTIKASDWRGNTVTRSWGFTVTGSNGPATPALSPPSPSPAGPGAPPPPPPPF